MKRLVLIGALVAGVDATANADGSVTLYGVDEVKIQKLAPIRATSDAYTTETWDDFVDAHP